MKVFPSRDFPKTHGSTLLNAFHCPTFVPELYATCVIWPFCNENKVIALEHWPDIREFITRSAEFGKTVGLECCVISRVYLMHMVYTCNTYFVMHWSM